MGYIQGRDSNGRTQTILVTYGGGQLFSSNSIEHTLLSGVIIVWSGSPVNVLGYTKFIIHIVASNVTSGGTVKLYSSNNDVNYTEISSSTIKANGVTEINITNKPYKYLKASLTSRVDGTYTVTLIGGI
jgi:hypothetical protein